MMSNNITIVIVAMILILFVRSMFPNSKRNFKNEIVSLGVFGTFVGISIGLFHFDVTHLKESMPLLLEGLKTAFITPGVGIFFSIILSIFKPKKEAKSEMLGALELVVRDFNNNLTAQFGDNFKQLNESVKNMIVWQENYKTQIQNQEQSLNNILNELKQVSVLKDNEEKNIQKLINNLSSASDKVRDSLEETTDIVKENMQLLLREANGKL
jgi:methyl-accepting chemotaxis protein